MPSESPAELEICYLYRMRMLRLHPIAHFSEITILLEGAAVFPVANTEVYWHSTMRPSFAFLSRLTSKVDFIPLPFPHSEAGEEIAFVEVVFALMHCVGAHHYVRLRSAYLIRTHAPSRAENNGTAVPVCKSGANF
jgi:hypothetical protein